MYEKYAPQKSTSFIVTLWCQTLYICSTHSGAKISKCYINMTDLIQPVFKFWCAADHTRHLIPVSKDATFLNLIFI
jgi:hypothetical protein